MGYIEISEVVLLPMILVGVRSFSFFWSFAAGIHSPVTLSHLEFTAL